MSLKNDNRHAPVRIVDSHTAGEPTRVILSGGPLLNGSLVAQRAALQADYDDFRTSVLSEPRGSEIIVGALLCPPQDPAAATGVIFFNDVGYLGMCGHGTIGVVTTLAYLGRITPGSHQIETPVGDVSTTLHMDGSVTVQNVSSYRYRANVPIEIPGFGPFQGDIAWGGNWFFLIEQHPFVLDASNRNQLVAVTTAIRQALMAAGITGADGALIDHVELNNPARGDGNSGRNFVLCPGASFDRSPCGTGTSAKMACLYADGKLAPGAIWRQEGILDTVFEGCIAIENGRVLPSITGRAYITAESTLLFDRKDPFCHGIAFEQR